MRRLLAIIALACLGVLGAGATTPVVAHTVLLSSTPAAGSTVPALPESVVLTFADPLVTVTGQHVDVVTVIDPMAQVISAANSDVTGAVVSTVLHPTMTMDGDYVVTFRVVALDGHVVNGSFRFTVKADVGTGSPGATSIAIPMSGTSSLSVTATGAGVMDGVGAAAGSATGSFLVNFTATTLCYEIATTGLGEVTAVHIHPANTTDMSISDEIFIPVDLAAVDSGTTVCSAVKPLYLAELAADPGRYVLMVHTAAYPDGAVAGPFTGPAPSAATAAGPSSSTTSLTGTSVALGLAALVMLLGATLVAVISHRRSPVPLDDHEGAS